MSNRTREKLFNMRLSDEEKAKLQMLAEAEDMSSSALVRRLIRQRYEVHFGSVKPVVGEGPR